MLSPTFRLDIYGFSLTPSLSLSISDNLETFLKFLKSWTWILLAPMSDKSLRASSIRSALIEIQTASVFSNHRNISMGHILKGDATIIAYVGFVLKIKIEHRQLPTSTFQNVIFEHNSRYLTALTNSRSCEAIKYVKWNRMACEWSYSLILTIWQDNSVPR